MDLDQTLSNIYSCGGVKWANYMAYGQSSEFNDCIKISKFAKVTSIALVIFRIDYTIAILKLGLWS